MIYLTLFANLAVSTITNLLAHFTLRQNFKFADLANAFTTILVHLLYIKSDLQFANVTITLQMFDSNALLIDRQSCYIVGPIHQMLCLVL